MGEERLLLRTQRNDILQLITKLNLDPLEFEFHRIKSGLVLGCIVSKLFHKPTKYYFNFDFSQYDADEYWTRIFPYK